MGWPRPLELPPPIRIRVTLTVGHGHGWAFVGGLLRLLLGSILFVTLFFLDPEPLNKNKDMISLHGED